MQRKALRVAAAPIPGRHGATGAQGLSDPTLRISRLIVAASALVAAITATQAAEQATQIVRVKVNEVSLVAGNPMPPVVFMISKPSHGGGPPRVDGHPLRNSNADTWLQYSSILPATGGSRSLQVTLSSEVPPGLAFAVSAAAPAPGGGGTTGVRGPGSPNLATGQIATLTTGIGSCSTGLTPMVSGVNVVWTCTVVNLRQVQANSATVEATYTLTAAQ